LRDLDENALQSGILTNKNKYHNILIDLKTESIPKEIIYKYPISLLFKFYVSIKGHLIELIEAGDLNMFSTMLTKLEKKGYISREYYKNRDDYLIFDFNMEDVTEEYYEYNGYTGNYETYLTFKELLKVYLEGINLYNYKGKYYTYDQLKNKYDINSLEHSKFINDNLLEYTNDVDKSFEDLINYHPDIIKVSCKCIEIQDPSNYLTNPLSKLKLIFRANSVFGDNIKNRSLS
jgi:hypothetical protein